MVLQNNVIQDSQSIWLFRNSMNKSTSSASIALLSLRYEATHYGHVERHSTSFPEEVNILLDTYATEDMIAETDTKIVRFT